MELRDLNRLLVRCGFGPVGLLYGPDSRQGNVQIASPWFPLTSPVAVALQSQNWSSH